MRPHGATGLCALLLAASCGGESPGSGAGGGQAEPGEALRALPPVVALEPADLDPPGFWSASGEGEGLWARTPTVTPDEAESALRDIGYAQGFEAAPQASGVFAHAPERVQPGPTLVVSGHAPEAYLMALDGTRLHGWSHAFERIPGAPRATPQQAGCWRRVAVARDGRLYAIHEGVGLVALARDSSLRWFHGGGEHHDLELLESGGLLVLARRSRVDPSIHADYPVLEDQLLWLDDAGEVTRSLSLLEAWRTSDYAGLLERRPYLVGDITHTNSVHRLTEAEADALRAAGQPEAFAEGNLLLSARMLDAVFVVDPEARGGAGRVVWARSGPWLRPHDPSPTPDGRLLLFDNRGYRGFSQVLEVDLAADRVAWSWRGDPPARFDSIFLGAAQRLGNGNTLITEGCAGRAFEVTRTGEVVWEFVSGHRTGAEGELVAALFDVVRLPVGFGADW